MKTFIVLLKGINVGGHKKVPMAELRALLSKTGFENVRTYIQSGNVILETKNKEKHEIEALIEKAILDHFGFEVSVLAMTRLELSQIFDASPFSDAEKVKSYFMMLHATPDAKSVNEASEKTYDGEDYFIIKNCIYYHSAKGFGKSKFNVNYFERKLNTFATARNYNTMVKLLSLSEI